MTKKIVSSPLNVDGDLSIKGKVNYGESGSEDYAEAGFIHDQYGNFQHKRNTATDSFCIKNYDGTTKFKVYPETGIVEASNQYVWSSGSSWIKDRDAATVRNNNGTQDGSYKPVISQKTKEGNWTIGNLSGDNNLYFNYTTDTNYNNNNNTSLFRTINTSGNFSGNAANVTQKTSASSKTHSNFGTNNGYLPDMSFIAYWNGAYSSGNASNLTYAHQGTIQCKPTNLYNNTSGTTGTVTLSQSVANFTYIEIQYCTNGGDLFRINRVYSPNGKYTNLSIGHIYGGGTMEYQVKDVYMNGTSITVRDAAKNSGYWWATNGSAVSLNSNSSSYNIVKITRVDGYK